MARQQMAQRRRSSLIEQDTHLCFGYRTTCDMPKDGPYLTKGNTRKQRNNFVDGDAVFQVLE